MKDLDKTQVYDLRGITEEQARELLDWLVEYDSGWETNHDFFYSAIQECTSIEHTEMTTRWHISNSNPMTHISTLFEQSYEEKLQEAIEKLEHYKKEVERLENESKTKVGDVCKFWYDVESDFFIGILTGIVGVSVFPYQAGGGEWFKNAKKVTEQEVIDLLFKKS